MLTHARVWWCLAIAVGLVAGRPALAQTHRHTGSTADSTHHHATPKRPAATAKRPAPTSKRPAAAAKRQTQQKQGHEHGKQPSGSMQGMDHGRMAQTMDHGEQGTMGAMYGPYPMTREASGTAWQPDRARHRGLHWMRGSWMLMLHGAADLVLDTQGGLRGDDKIFSSNMLMGMAQRPVGPGKLGLRAMLSLEPATIGKNGYPLLLQTGETADGQTRLIDRQHPHDLFMELAASYSISSGNRSLFLYGGLPGEPALGPPAFMHRFSGMAVPQAPITHHWLDSSHITFGVLTAGGVLGPAKLEASAFRGREPDQNRYDIESPKLDSHSFRFSLNPTPSWALQASYGRLTSPEQLEPDVDVDRTTASAIHAADWGTGHWETTLAWGRNRSRPGPTLDAIVLESAMQLRERHTLFARAERVEKNELFPEGDPRDGLVYRVGQLAAGYRYDFWRSERVALGLGALGTISFVSRSIRDVYGGDPTSGMVFAHVELR
ncbi:MAG TPA: hypothetical protein VGJ98_02205 [Candidatus Eisenbacteria bacterium]